MNLDQKAAEIIAPYPEHDKLHVVKDQSQVIGAFLEWLQTEKKVHLAVWHEVVEDEDYTSVDSVLMSITDTIEELLADYFKIDLDKLEEEKLQMLEECRRTHEKEEGQ